MTSESTWPPVHNWEIVRVADLPTPDRISRPRCMAKEWGYTVGVSPPARRFAQAFPHRGSGPPCCWYHQVDWHQVCTLATYLFAQCGQEWGSMARAAERLLPELERQALGSLWLDPMCLWVDPNTCSLADYVNGQHRAHAMMRAGVPRVVVDTAP